MAVISIQDAVRIAEKHLREVFGSVTDVRLEEVERKMNDWIITLSFADRSAGAIGALIDKREYKTIEIEGETGDVRSIRMRVLNE